METNTPYTSYGECRCCLAKGHHRDVTKEYYFNNIREVYIDIFMECFNLSLKSHKDISTLICSTCVQRLRDATSFRMMVASTERHLLEAIPTEDDKNTVFIDIPDPMSIEEQGYSNNIKAELKIEHIEVDPEEFADVFEKYDLEGDDSEDNRSDGSDIDKVISEEFQSDDCDNTYCAKDKNVNANTVDGELELLARFSKDVLRPLPTRRELLRICPQYSNHLEKLRDKIVRPKSIEWFFYKPCKNQYNFVSEKLAHTINATVLFEHSNATAFKTKMRNGYPCFYCREIYNHHALREHQRMHPKSIIYKLLTKYTADCLVVYADITDLKCTICNENVLNLNELKSHLTGVHEKKMYLEYPDRVIPFKLKDTDFECQSCGISFETFGAVERHMNVHYGNFICEECGAGFVTKHRLGIHAYLLHKKGNFPCEICKKNFPTHLKYKLHFDTVHRMLKKNKCPKCPEKFIDYFTRQRHMVNVHGAEPILYKCNLCDRSFNRKYTLSCHIKRGHLEQKDVKCEYCSYTCYNKTELKEHMVKHDGIKPFECGVCKKSYGRKKALLLHMRIHDNDRRFSCNVCGLSFVQKCTLKGHMKTHQFDLQSDFK